MRSLVSAPPTSRTGRYPRHTFQCKNYLQHIHPFMIAPVLPGETLENLYMEARVVSVPMKNSLIGCKQEFYFFYVRMTDLLSDTIRDMFVDPTNTDLAATLGVAATSQHYFTAKGGIDWLKRCVTRITEEYFRDDGETVATASSTINGDVVPIAQVREIGWMDSITDKDDMPAGPDPGSVSTAGDLEALMQAFEQLRALGMANMTYEDFLRSYGISIPQKDENKPEMIARFTDYQYPSNTIDPNDGSASAAFSWVFKNGSKERKFIKEPGFLIGISVTRPKVYMGGAVGGLSAHLSRAWDWLPNYLWNVEGQAATSLKKFLAGTGPLGDRTSTTGEANYWVDMRDLFLHGDQFFNTRTITDGTTATGDSTRNILLLPADQDSIAVRKYPTKSMMDGLSVGGSGYVDIDGYVTLNIKGHQVDYTQAHIADV